MKKNIIYIIILFVLGTILFIPKLKKIFLPIAEIEKSLHIEESDYNIDLKGINTTSSNLKNFRGKPLFLNFWGTWCQACRNEWPTIQKLYESKKSKINFVLIAMQDEEENVKKFLKENNYTAPVYIAESPISENLLPNVFPTTYILAKDGRILKKEEGSLDWNTEQIHSFIDNVLK